MGKNCEYYDDVKMRFWPPIEHLMFTFSKLRKIEKKQKTVLELMFEGQNKIKENKENKKKAEQVNLDDSLVILDEYKPRITLETISRDAKARSKKRKFQEMQE